MILILKVTHVWFLLADFKLFNCESDNLTFTLLYSTVYIIHRTFAVPFKNSNSVSFDFSRIIYNLIYVLLAPPTAPWNTMCWIALGSTSETFCLLKSTAISLQLSLKYA